MTVSDARRRVIVSLTASLLTTVVAAGCGLRKAPDATAIKEQALPAVKTTQWTAPGAGAGDVSGNWLATFRDDRLAALVAEAIVYNTDLLVGATRVEQAQLHAKQAGARMYPTVDFLAKGGAKMSGDGSGIQGAIITASWEIDLWGRVRYGREASAAQAASAQADFEYARQSIAATVAKSWFLATESELQILATREAIRASEALVRLAEDRARVGIGDQQDVLLARAGVGGYRDTLRQLELVRDQAIRALEILLGRYPAGIAATAPRLPGFPGEVPAGLPSQLLERRPDVIAAERRVAVAFNRVQEAKAARLPVISLTTGVSAISSDLFVLKDHSNPVWNVGANLLMPLFNGGALRTQVEIRTAEQKQAVAEYAAVGLRAFGEVEGALAAEFAAREREQILAQTLTDNELALAVVQTRFKVGSADLRFVEQQQLALNATRAALVRMQVEQRIQRVNLHLALGGSFDLPPQPATP